MLISTFGDEYKVPVTYNFNLTLEREVFTGVMARAAYVGSRNRNGRYGLALNYADMNIAGATTGNTDARRLYASAGLGQVESQAQDRKSNYNSMQLALIKRYSRGFTITSNYTLSKVEGDFGGEIIPYTMPQTRVAAVGSARPGSPPSLHHVVGVGYPGCQRRADALRARRLAVDRRHAVSRRVVRTP